MAKAAKKRWRGTGRSQGLAWRHRVDEKEGDILITDKVDPNLEITGIQKQLDGGCPILFNNVKGKPQHR